MSLCIVLTVVLLLVLLLILYGVGYVSGIPKLYRDALEGRLVCDDVRDSVVAPDNPEWRLTRVLQGGSLRVFKERMADKQTACLSNNPTAATSSTS